VSSLLPPSASSHAAQIDQVLALVHWLMLVLFVGWGAYFGWVLLRFRSKRQPAADHTGARGRLALGVEVGIVVAEVVLLVVFALPLWFSRTSARPTTADAITIRIVAEQFVWNVHYPGEDGQFGETSPQFVSPTNPLGLDRKSAFGKDDVVEGSLIHLPVGRPVVIQLSSKDVIHSFGIPAMRVKQDAVPGLFTPVWFTPTEIGKFEIVCSQFCGGQGHYRMRGQIVVESEADFRHFMLVEAAAQR